MHKINWKFDNTYSKLSETFREFVKPTPVHNPEIVIFNHQLAQELNLDFSKISNVELSKIFSGNSLPQESKTLAQAYAGHCVQVYQTTTNRVELVIDTGNGNTGNRWGSYVFFGGTDTITGNSPLSLVQYGFNSSTGRLYSS